MISNGTFASMDPASIAIEASILSESILQTIGKLRFRAIEKSQTRQRETSAVSLEFPKLCEIE